MARKVVVHLLFIFTFLAITDGASVRPVSIFHHSQAIENSSFLHPERYHNYDQMTSYLKDIHQNYPRWTRLYSIGQSVEGRHLWVLMISSTPDRKILLKPQVKFIGNIHGNEPVGRELLLRFIQYLLVNYPQDDQVRSVVESSDIHILPSMNPDGFEVSIEGTCRGLDGRFNANGKDLNRDFPDWLMADKRQEELQPETDAILHWLKENQFVLSASFHGGALVASYPFNNNYQTPLTPDNDVFKHLASTYSFHHSQMHSANPCKRDDLIFSNGITNGAAWYSFSGGMEDYNYVWNGVVELTLEVGCCKYPNGRALPELWNDNQSAMLKYLAEAKRGVRGQVLDPYGNPIPDAFVRIQGRPFGSKTTASGEYWRILLPGDYILQVDFDGFQPYWQAFRVIDEHYTRLDIVLKPVTQHYVKV